MNEIAEELIELADPKAVVFDGLDDAIIGVCSNGYLVYSHGKMTEIFMREGMSELEAWEWIDFNVLPSNAGKCFTVIHFEGYKYDA